MSFYMTFFLFDPLPQCLSLLGRIDGLGPGAVAAQGRRRRAKYQERLWARERKAHSLAIKQGFNIFRRGFAKLDRVLLRVTSTLLSLGGS